MRTPSRKIAGSPLKWNEPAPPEKDRTVARSPVTLVCVETGDLPLQEVRSSLGVALATSSSDDQDLLEDCLHCGKNDIHDVRRIREQLDVVDHNRVPWSLHAHGDQTRGHGRKLEGPVSSGPGIDPPIDARSLDCHVGRSDDRARLLVGDYAKETAMPLSSNRRHERGKSQES